MTNSFLARYFRPLALRTDKAERERVAAIRSRDGDNCRRCRRPIRFDLPHGHDKGPRVETALTSKIAAPQAIGELFLCHGRCHAVGADKTEEVAARRRHKNEAALLSRKRTA